MGNTFSTHTGDSLRDCIEALSNGRTRFAGFPDSPVYQAAWVKPYNLEIQVTPAAVVRPQTAEDVAGVVQCAAAYGVKVQARSGGHSYGNHGLGGVDGAVSIDLVNFQQFSVDNTTWLATVGAGTHLKDVAHKLHDAGGRAIAMGVSPGIGIGGHATIGGLGPSSRMWGSCLDHVVEVEVVTADGRIERASDERNPDLFWALKGAASGFGIITEFVFRTNPEPATIVQYDYTIAIGSQATMASSYSAWQDLVADPALDRRFASLYTMMPLGALITGTFHGTEAEFRATGIPARLSQAMGSQPSITISDWLGSLTHVAEKQALALSDIPIHFRSKSLAFRREDLPTPDRVRALFEWVDDQHMGADLWFVIFDASGGAVADVAMNATAFAHRDKVLYYQSYMAGLYLDQRAKTFVDQLHVQILGASPAAEGTYPGYVDPALSDAQRHYWGTNLPQLQALKQIWDAEDVFHNPQSVRAVWSGGH
ncbi:uncharacterized protein B0T15DRAFT_505774 [Chaetomium strumarium]|uniref:FAD-binding PCMH-type domain-containing protein n=1 Tax=Chaetomium strumarium TaxID=1170767 RepID=A0AAJ0GMQ1_9PEZI|nr:hypothetical protein B0T15DRAFT_505774 [Chaetomium strumarium]